jgi:hypothetical protein
MTGGCAGSTCRKITAALSEVDRRPAELAQAHARMTIPHRTLDVLLAAQARALPTVQVPIPAVAGVSVGTLQAAVEGVRARPAPRGAVGLTVQVALRSGGRTLVGFELDADVRPEVDPRAHQVVIPLQGRDLRGVRPRLGPGGTRALVDAVHAQLPQAARAMVSKQDLARLLQAGLADLTDLAAGRLLASAGGDLGTLARVELDLGDLPLRAIEVESTSDALVLGLVTPLPVSRGVALTADPVPPMQVALRLSGSTVAELANHAVRTGLIPDRYDDQGESAPNGRWTPRFGWSDTAPPFRLHLWSTERDCARVELAATGRLALAAGHLELRTDDARIVDVDGSARIRAGIAFSGLGRRTFRWVEQLATSFRFDIGDRSMAAQITGAQIQGNEVLLTLNVTTESSRPVRAALAYTAAAAPDGS